MTETCTQKKIAISLDIGCVRVKGLALDQGDRVLHRVCLPVQGQGNETVRHALESFAAVLPANHCRIEAVTGSSSGPCATQLGLTPINELHALFLGTVQLVPCAGSIVEVGGEHAHFLRLNARQDGQPATLRDSFVNSVCLAGSGAFLDQEAHRLGLTVDDLTLLARKSQQPVPIAGRCAVFAKTDLVHLAQNGVPLEEIVNALCTSVARNIGGELIGGREFLRPLVFVGGVASNAAVVEALRRSLGLDEVTLVVPDGHGDVVALGAYEASKGHTVPAGVTLGEAIATLKDSASTQSAERKTFPPLGIWTDAPSGPSTRRDIPRSLEGTVLGVDVGSTSTNVVCMTASGEIVDHCSMPTRGQALRVVGDTLEHIRAQVGHVAPAAVGVTGSGRRLIAEMIGADSVVNEITAHALGGMHLYPDADTIFDIGGQDAKYIRLEDGRVVDFEMNKVCAAGTGSFLEEAAALLGLDIRTAFVREALRSAHPADLGERCTVFISSELVHRRREGVQCTDLAAGLCYAVARNYLARVVRGRRVGQFVSFQGGVAGNAAVVLALQHLLQKRLHVHPYHECAGAIGAALIAARNAKGSSRFLGFKVLATASMRSRSFVCRRCSNACHIYSTVSPSGRKFSAGALCELFDGPLSSSALHHSTPSTDLLEARTRALQSHARVAPADKPRGDLLGIPRALLFHELLPFWTAFFNTLGVAYQISGETTQNHIRNGARLCPSNPCLPMKIAYGHCAELLDQGIRRLFIPSISSLAFRTEEERLNHVCPAVQAWPYTARACLPDHVEILMPSVRFAIRRLLELDMMALGSMLGAEGMESIKALHAALDAQGQFQRQLVDRGKTLLASLDTQKTYALILSRPYTLFDQRIQLGLGKILNELGIVAIPPDALDAQPRRSTDLDGMYWYFGKRFLQAAETLRRLPHVVAIHLSAYGCGSDSFIIHFLRQGLTGIPLLELEIDEHSDFTGVATRLEAFVDSLRNSPRHSVLPPVTASRDRAPKIPYDALHIPQMSDHAFAVSAAFRSCGVAANVLPLPDEESLTLGREAVAGGECFPCVAVMGDMLRYLHNNNRTTSHPAFFMVSGDGPCRLGQYPYLQRLILHQRGHEGVPILNTIQDPTFYRQLGALSSSFTRRAWKGIVAVDILYRKWREIRPYSTERNQIDRIYRHELQCLCETIEHRGNIGQQLAASFTQLEREAHEVKIRRPIIAVLGENYVRCNAAANANIAEVLEDFGAEVWFPSLYEWLYYTNWTARQHCRYEQRYGQYLKCLFVDIMQHWSEWILLRRAGNRLRNVHEPSIREVFDLTAPYVPRTFEGETLLSIGRTVDFFRKGAAGVIHVVPFGCIVGTIVETLCNRISKDLHGFPILMLQSDGQLHQVPRATLEGFWLRVQDQQNRSNAHR